MARTPARCCLSRVATSRGYEYGSRPEGRGWVGFAAILLGLAGTWNVLEGLLASGSSFGRWFGIASAFVNSSGQLSFVPAYPFWALAMVAIDIVVIYALAT